MARRTLTRTEEACRILGIVCAVLSWSIYASIEWTPTVLERSGEVKGWDFPQFYALGRLAAQERREAVADGRAIGAIATRDVSPTLARSTFVPVYPPQVALFFAPFARLSYLGAMRAWIALSILLYGLCCLIVWRACPALRPFGATVSLLAVGSPILFFLVCYAQISAVALGLLTAAFVALRHGRSVVAGMAIGSLVYKPQLGMAIGLVFLFAGEWRIVAGAIASATAQIAVGLAWAGTSVMRSYVHTITHLTDNIVLIQEKRHLLQSLESFYELLLPWPKVVFPAYVASALLVLVLAWLVWKSDAPLELRYSMLLLATPLVSPHFYVYDLLILVPALFFIPNWILEITRSEGLRVAGSQAPGIQYRSTQHLAPQHPAPRYPALCTLLVLLYLAPAYGGVVAKIFRLQLTTLVLLGLVIAIAFHVSQEGSRELSIPSGAR